MLLRATQLSCAGAVGNLSAVRYRVPSGGSVLALRRTSRRRSHAPDSRYIGGSRKALLNGGVSCGVCSAAPSADLKYVPGLVLYGGVPQVITYTGSYTDPSTTRACEFHVPQDQRCRRDAQHVSRVHPVGFIGLGTMGEPMARNLLRAVPLVVWNRTGSKCRIFADAGAAVAADPTEVFVRCKIVILMLTDGDAMDAVLSRGQSRFTDLVRGRTLINMATTSPRYSQALEEDARSAGGRYVEAPVSGSRKPAEAGQLVGMLAGDLATVETVEPLLFQLCRTTVYCGAVPKALLTKLAVNQFMITMTAGLAEAMHFARQQGLDIAKFVRILDDGPMASEYSRVKAAKLLADDFSIQAAIRNVRESTRLISAAAREAQISAPLIDLCDTLYAESMALGCANEDIIGVLHAIEERSATTA